MNSAVPGVPIQCKAMNLKNPVAATGLAAAFLLAAPALPSAQAPGAAQSFAVVGGQSVTAAAGGTQTLIDGDVGVSPGTSITGFPANATTVPPYGRHVNDGAAQDAQAATLNLYNVIGGLGPGTSIGNELGGEVYGPGTYSIGAANIAANTNLTLSGAGTYIFKVASSLTANVNSTMTLVGVDPCDVYWRVTSAATLNGVNFAGNVVAQAAVTLGSNATLAGRALTTALGDVTLAGGNIIGGCSAAPIEPPPPAPAADLIVSKSHTGNFDEGENGVYTIRVTNIGGTSTVGDYTITDTLPDGLTSVSASGAGWSCANAGQVVTCTSSAVLAPDATSTAITLTVAVDADAVPSVINPVRVDGGGDTVLDNNTDIDFTIVTPEVPPVPTMSQWALAGLAALMGLVGFVAIRRRTAAPVR
jgi:type VI secretion system secreted protein VgrG